MVASAEQVAAGQAVYTKRVLHAYDFFVLGVSNRLLWKCPTPRLLELYDENVSARHLDVGIGTGYYLDRCRFPAPEPRIALVDLNPQALAFASRRIARYSPDTYQRNVLEPFELHGERFDSAALSYVLHCLPGTMAEKSVVFDHLEPHLNPGARVFGSTLLPDATLGRVARGLMATYNRKGIFSNQQDSEADLRRELVARFSEVSIERVGCGALFVARV